MAGKYYKWGIFIKNTATNMKPLIVAKVVAEGDAIIMMEALEDAVEGTPVKYLLKQLK